MTRTILVTGGLGYVGGRIAQFLAADDAIDLRLGSRTAHVGRPAWISRGRVVSVDLMDDASLTSACQGVDTIIHLAGTNEIDSAQNPEAALIINGLGSLRLVRAAERAGVRRFIFFSTAHVYGAPLHGVITEQTLTRPVHPYATTHRVAEDLVLAAHDAGRLDGVVVRLSNGFGAPAHPNINRWTLIANDLCRQAVTTHVLTLRSAGTQWRDFITLGDVARATSHLVSLDRRALQDGLFNLGGKNAIRIIDLARRISERCGATLGLVPEIRRPEESIGSSVEDELDYRIDKFESTGFALQGNVDAEIDATLRLCHASFGSAHASH